MATTSPDRELIRLHRRACTDMAARMRLPRWEHLAHPLAAPLDDHTVADLLTRVVVGDIAFAADLSGGSIPTAVDVGDDPVAAAVESIRTVLTVVSGLDPQAGFSPARREQFWQRIVELTVLGHDLQQAIHAGAGLDDILVDRILTAGPPGLSIWPWLEPDDRPVTGPEDALLALVGRPAGLRLVADDQCATGEC